MIITIDHTSTEIPVIEDSRAAGELTNTVPTRIRKFLPTTAGFAPAMQAAST